LVAGKRKPSVCWAY